jgi:hypothetical protein
MVKKTSADSGERRLRERAAKMGLKIVKNRTRKNPRSPFYGRYHLFDTKTKGQLTPHNWVELDVVEMLIEREEKRRVK